MNMKYLVGIVAILGFSAGCTKVGPGQTKVQERVVTKHEYVERKVPKQSRPRGVNIGDVEFHVVNESNFEAFKKEFIKKNGKFVFVAISVNDYETLALNLAELERYIKQQKEIIVYYEGFTN